MAEYHDYIPIDSLPINRWKRNSLATVVSMFPVINSLLPASLNTNAEPLPTTPHCLEMIPPVTVQLKNKNQNYTVTQNRQEPVQYNFLLTRSVWLTQMSRRSVLEVQGRLKTAWWPRTAVRYSSRQSTARDL